VQDLERKVGFSAHLKVNPPFCMGEGIRLWEYDEVEVDFWG
jgi:hypothetical protein